MTRNEALKLIKKFDGKYPHLSVNAFIEYSGMSKKEIDNIIDSYTNPVLFKMNEDGTFKKDIDGNLIKNYKIT